MAKILLNFLIFLLFLQYIRCNCINNDPCVCIIDEYTKINITSATINKTNQFDFLTDKTDNIAYYFHGCVDTNYKWSNQSITTTLFRLNSTNGTEITNFGDHSFYKFNYDKDQDIYQLLYTTKYEVVATVHLLCDNFKTSFIKILNIAGNELVLSSPYNCKIVEHPGLSTGSFFVILLIISIAIYLVGGGLILYFIRGARGLELIPNIDFWRSLPGLMKDGVIFLISGCNVNSISTAETYDRI